MPKVKYQDIAFREGSLAIIAKANEIIAEYQAQGFDLTLRQLYYQFVARDLIANKQSEYKRLGSIVNDGRLAGLIDWEVIVDRTRNLESLSTWRDPSSIVGACAEQFRVDRWATQPKRLECWIEKEALVGVIQGVCEKWRVPYFACRGYTSQSEMWSAAMRLRKYARKRQEPVILHLGDHDPSGVDMTRDVTDRLAMFMGGVEVRRLALNFEQIQEHDPPPNPVKLTDSRCDPYIQRFGEESWELDALDPTTIADLIEKAIESELDADAWESSGEEEDDGREALGSIAERFDDVVTYLAQE